MEGPHLRPLRPQVVRVIANGLIRIAGRGHVIKSPLGIWLYPPQERKFASHPLSHTTSASMHCPDYNGYRAASFPTFANDAPLDILGYFDATALSPLIVPRMFLFPMFHI